MDKLALACTCAAAICLLALAGLAKQIEPVKKTVDGISLEDEGRLLRVVGRVQAVGQSHGNYFLTLCWGKCVSAVVFAGTARQMSGNLEISSLERGSVVSVDGVVGTYQGKPELVVSSPHAIEVLK